MADAKKKIRRIKRISYLLIFLAAAALAVYFLPFPWYVHTTKPMVYYEAKNPAQSETGVLEVEGWMLCYMFKPDHFYGTLETFMSDVTYQRGQYKVKTHIRFNEDPLPDVELADGYRMINFEKVDCTGDTQTFVDYWMNGDRSPIVSGRFQQVILQRTGHSGGQTVVRSYGITDAKNAGKAQDVLLKFQTDNPDYPMLPTP